MSHTSLTLGAALLLRCCSHDPDDHCPRDGGPPDAAVSCPASLTWQVEPSGTTADLSGVWGASDGDVYAVGSGGTVVHLAGGVWSPAASGVTDDLHAVWGSSASDVYAVGVNRAVLRTVDHGVTWTVRHNGGALGLSVFGAGPNDVYIADQNAILFSSDSGATWTSHSPQTPPPIPRPLTADSIWAESATNVFAGGDLNNRKIVTRSANQFADFTWAETTGNPSGVLDLWGSGPGDLWAVGAPSEVARSDDEGATFTDVTPPASMHGMVAVWGSGPNDVYVADVTPALYHSTDRGATWTTVSLPTTSAIRDIWGADCRHVYLVGPGGVIVHGHP
jgi:photosystem II stability/assembly factor-like uncharacterized protein